MQRAYRHSTRVTGALICGLGLAMIVAALARGGGPLALGVVLGTMFAILGAGRFVLAGSSRHAEPERRTGGGDGLASRRRP